MDRRHFLRCASTLACSAAAHPFLTTVTLAGDAAALGENRLVAVILRGAADGLAILPPVGDPSFAAHRPTLAQVPDAIPLDGMFALHPLLRGWADLWAAGELAFAPAVSTPYRDKRSHFDGQDILEAGTAGDAGLGQARDGWLNRMLQSIPGLRGETAYAVGREALAVLDGPFPARQWSPDLSLDLSPQARLLLQAISHDDPLFRDAALEAMELADLPAGATVPLPEGERVARRLAEVDRLADFAADRLAAGTRIAAFSLSGWDTHRAQAGGIGLPLMRLERLVLRLRERLGPVWARTTVLAMTEFGRTVRENGSRGTDHGTGGALIAAGGAVRGGRILGRWPGLAEGDLYDGRDLLPTSDVRAWAAWAMRDLYGFDRSLLEGAVFPGLDMGDQPGLIL